jgi:UDP-N-acetylglucosamine 2-epimerase
MADACNPYGDGRAAERIIKILLAASGYPIIAPKNLRL